jgi:hypothetical protein
VAPGFLRGDPTSQSDSQKQIAKPEIVLTLGKK